MKSQTKAAFAIVGLLVLASLAGCGGKTDEPKPAELQQSAQNNTQRVQERASVNSPQGVPAPGAGQANGKQ